MLDKLNTVFSRPWIYCVLILAKASMLAGFVFSGGLVGNDDYMRIEQVSNLLSGQGWFDTHQSDYVSPEGGNIHWSRIPDLGVIAFYSLANLFVGHEQSLAFASFVWPTLLFCGLAVVLVSFARKLGLGAVGIIFCLLIVATGYGAAQFLPGRVDHHGLNILLGFTALRLILERSFWSSALSGVLTAAMISVAIESLPFAFSIALVFGLQWVIEPELEQDRFPLFGAGLAGAAGFFYLADAPGWNSVARAVCDAYGSGHFAALIVGGLGVASLGPIQRTAFGARLKTALWARLVAGVIVGGLAIAALTLVAPYCLASPYANVPEIVIEQWLSRVKEARSIFAGLEADAPKTIAQYLVPILSLVVAIWWQRRANDDQRRTMLVLIVPLTVSILAGLWQYRGLALATLLGSLPAAVVFSLAFTTWRKEGGPVPLAGALIATVCLAPFIPDLVAKRLSPVSSKPPILNSQNIKADCYAPEAIRPLNEVPDGTVLGHIDVGARLLRLTHHKIVAAPYHRNVEGIAAFYDTFGAESEDAFMMRLRATGADYVLVCDDGIETGLENSPIKVKLATGGEINGLTPIPVEGTPMRIFRVGQSD